MRWCILIIIFLLSPFCSFSENKAKTDSLKAAYQTATHDTTRINALLLWGKEINVNKLDSAIILYKNALELAKKSLSENLDGKTVLGDGLVKVFKKLLANAYYNIADRYYYQGEIDKALEYYFLSLKISEEMKEQHGMANCYNSIALTYEYQGELDKALEYYFLSLKIREEFKDTEGMAHQYWNIASFYHIKKDYTNCISYYTKAASSYFELNNSYGNASGFYTKGTLFEIENKLDSAIYSYKQAISYYKEIDHIQYVGWCYREVSYLFSLKNDLIKAVEYAENSLSLAKKLGIVGDINYAARFLSSYYRKQSRFEDALSMYELEIEMQDSIVNKETQKAIIRQQMKYEYEKEELIKEQEEKEQLRIAIEAQSRRDDLHYAGIFIGMFLLFGVVLMLGFVKVPPKGAEAIIFLSFLILFEFLLVLLDPFVEEYTGGAPIFKLLLNALLAGLIFPLHQFFEKKLKKKLVGGKKEKLSKEVKALMFLGLVFIHPLLFAQNSKVDSLKSAYEVAEHDTTRINILFTMGEELIMSNPDTVLIIEKKAMDICKKNLAEILDNKTSLKVKEGLADAYNNIGFIYGNQGEIEDALEYNFLSLRIKEELKDKKGMAFSYNNIAAIYDDQGEIEKALKYYFLSLKLREDINDKSGTSDSYNNIGAMYYKQGEIQMALKYHFLCLNLTKEIKDNYRMAMSYHNIGSTLCELDSVVEGMKYMKLGLSLKKELGYKAGVSVTTSLIGTWQLKLGHVQAALDNGLEALNRAKEIGHVHYMERAAELLSDVYRKQGKFEDALVLYELEIQMRDSIVNEENTKATIRQQMKYEHEKEQLIQQEQEIEQARIHAEVTSRRNNLHYSAIFIGILILFGGVLMLGFVKIRPKDVEGIIFISFLILFEFVLVLADPHVEQYTGGAPGFKLLFNAGIAGLMFPLHQFFEGKLKKRIIKVQRKKTRKMIKQYKEDVEEM